MSQWQPTALTAEQLKVAKAPETGVETRVYASLVEPSIVGKILVDSAGTVSYESLGSPAGGGEHLHLRVVNPGENIPIANADAVDVTLDANAGVVALLGTLNLASYDSQRDTNFFRLTEGRGIDLTDAGDTLITAVDGTIASSNNLPNNSEFLVLSLPDADDFLEVACAIQKSTPYNNSQSVRIKCGYDPQAFTKKGVKREAEMTITYRHKSAVEGMMMFNGGRCCIMLETKKDDLFVQTREFFIGAYPNVEPGRENDDDDVVIATMTSSYEKYLTFTAA